LGMLTKKGVYTVFNNDMLGSLKADDHTLNQAEILLDEAYNEAVRLLKQEKVFLLEIANYLSQKTCMNQKTFKKIAIKSCINLEFKKNGFINKEGDFFRTKLKAEIEGVRENEKPKIIVNIEEMILNKDSV